MVLYANAVYGILHNNKKMSKGGSGIITASRQGAKEYSSISRTTDWSLEETVVRKAIKGFL